jgi:hypothetical protein
MGGRRFELEGLLFVSGHGEGGTRATLHGTLRSAIRTAFTTAGAEKDLIPVRKMVYCVKRRDWTRIQQG